MAPRPLNVLSLFSGGGGLDLAIERALPGSRVVCHVEGEAYAAAVLAARMAEGALAEAPVWSNVRTFDGRPWRGVVDCVAGGWPCTDLSLAGKRAGIGGEHSGLWREFVRIVREVEPRLVIMENVPPLVSHGLDRVLGALHCLGFDAEWGCLRASAVGAPHRRERVFILAYARRFSERRIQPVIVAGSGREAVVGPDGEAVEHALAGSEERFAISCDCGTTFVGKLDELCPGCGRIHGGYTNQLADADRDGRRGPRLHVPEWEPRSAVCDADGAGATGPVEHAGGARLEERAGECRDDGAQRAPAQRAGTAPFPPGPDDAAGWRRYLALYPECAPTIARPEPNIRRGADVVAPRVDQDV